MSALHPTAHACALRPFSEVAPMPEHQNDLLLRALREGPMTSLQILDRLGIARAAARVHELRQAGHSIRSTPVEVLNRRGEPCRVALYSLESPQLTLLPEGPGRGAMTAEVRA